MRVGMGIGGALMWPAILGMTYAALPESKAGLAGGLILGAAGIGNAMGPLLGGVLTDELALALDLLPQRADRRLRRPRHLAKVHQPRPEVEDQRIDYPGIATLSTGLLLHPAGLRPGGRLGLRRTRAVIAMLVVAVTAAHRASPSSSRG